jgi:hypothetical protein
MHGLNWGAFLTCKWSRIFFFSFFFKQVGTDDVGVVSVTLSMKWRCECVYLATSRQDGVTNASSIVETMGMIVRQACRTYGQLTSLTS